MSDRKYRQRGYQDSDREGSSGKRGGGPVSRPPREGPRGRGLGRPTESVFRCAQCGRRIPLLQQLENNATCPQCDTALHSCTHCQYFDTTAPMECRQPIEKRIARKSDANECELFAPRMKQEFESGSRDRSDDGPDDPRAAFDALFKK